MGSCPLFLFAQRPCARPAPESDLARLKCAPHTSLPACPPFPRQEVESYFINARRYMLRGCHVGYWMGYRAQAWGKFLPLDKTLKNLTYSHYGMMNVTFPGGATGLLPEPNGKARGEMCLMANMTQAFGGAFGWADANCNDKQIFMCRIMGALRGAAAGRLRAAGGCGPRVH